MNTETRLTLERVAKWARDHSQVGSDIEDDAAAVLRLLAEPDPPPNTHRVRIVVDLSPEDEASGKRHVWLNLADGDTPATFPHRRENGWQRSIVVADIPVPEPIAEIVGAVDGP